MKYILSCDSVVPVYPKLNKRAFKMTRVRVAVYIGVFSVLIVIDDMKDEI